ncbi:MAG: Gldg family protein [Clostridia bacterium]|nr:Gldg family protein [Clostridia bacterium]
MKKNNTGKKYALTSLITALVLAVVLIGVNIAFAFAPARYTELDTTSSGLYAISQETRRFLAKLDDEVTLYVINSDGTQAPVDIFIERYAQYGDSISVEYVNTEEDTDFLTSHGYDGTLELNPYSIMVSSEKRSRIIDFYSLYHYSNDTLGISSMSYSEYSQYGQIFSSSESYSDYLYSLIYESTLYFDGDSLISNAVEYVTVSELPQTYFITGRGENSSADGNLAALLDDIGYSYGVHDITVSAGIPSNASFIVINEPDTDYTDGEREIILDYLKNGGRMLLVTGDANISMANLMSIAEYYGVSTSEGYVLEKPDEESGTDESDGESEDYVVEPAVNTEHDIFASFTYTPSMERVTAITVSEELRRAQLVSPVLTVSDAYISDPEAADIYTIGVAVEEETEGGTTRIVWFTGADSFNGEDAPQNNLAMLVFSMAWMDETYTSSLGAIPSPIYEDAILNVSTSAYMWLTVLLMIIIPAAVLAGGIFIYVKRRKA